MKLQDLLKDIELGKVYTDKDKPPFKVNEDHKGESRMAKSDLFKMSQYSKTIHNMIDDDMDLPEWVESKLTKASDYLGSVKHYLEYEMQYPGQENAFDDDTDPYEMGFNEVHSLDDILPAIKRSIKENTSFKFRP